MFVEFCRLKFKRSTLHNFLYDSIVDCVDYVDLKLYAFFVKKDPLTQKKIGRLNRPIYIEVSGFILFNSSDCRSQVLGYFLQRI